ncbi:MAG TPA: methionine--tRNA ligase [Candidatus Polarisedimenticolia bacterium]|jgi:methionyl-tRNA synthetase|nr:methionine--tRNA ligase [Candidatus Polarisedimenticolia bacterium]
MSKFYVTTPIYYVNDSPHIGHAYTTVVADVLARFHRMGGEEVYFLTGTDEHGQKIEDSASARGLTALALADQVVERYHALWKRLMITHDDFIRTTEERHQRGVLKIYEKIAAAGSDIYKGRYEGWYCKGCEAFYPDSQIVEGRCPDQGHPVERLTEESYFFRLSKYQKPLLEHYEKNPGFILPETRRNEIVSFVSAGLRDLSISRTSFRWGIPFPSDPKHIFYVWFDALSNYVTALEYAGSEGLYRRFWPADVHLVGKDILRFHAVYWPAFLMAAGIPLPRSIVAHGWWLRDAAKMSKSRGNVIEPNALLDEFGVDAVRYFLMREMAFGQDASYSDEALIDRNNSDLANDLGNLVSRTLKLIENSCEGKIPDPGERTRRESPLTSPARAAHQGFVARFRDFDFSGALARVWDLVSAVNRYLVENEPWKLHGPAARDTLAEVLYSSAESLRIVGLLIAPVMPKAAGDLWKQLGIAEDPARGAIDPFRWGALSPGQPTARGAALFPRIDKKAYMARAAEEPPAPGRPERISPWKEKKMETQQPPSPEDGLTIEEFRKIHLKVGRVIAAEKVEGAKKLLRLQVDLGSEVRQIISGIADKYAPESLVGKQIVLVANLKPATIRGVESRGMLLAAEDASGQATIVTFDEPVTTGATVR